MPHTPKKMKMKIEMKEMKDLRCPALFKEMKEIIEMNEIKGFWGPQG